jgi:hypothetical protein
MFVNQFQKVMENNIMVYKILCGFVQFFLNAPVSSCCDCSVGCKKVLRKSKKELSRPSIPRVIVRKKDSVRWSKLQWTFGRRTFWTTSTKTYPSPCWHPTLWLDLDYYIKEWHPNWKETNQACLKVRRHLWRCRIEKASPKRILPVVPSRREW